MQRAATLLSWLSQNGIEASLLLARARGRAFGLLRWCVRIGVHPELDGVIPIAVHSREQLVIFVQLRHFDHLLHHLLRIRLAVLVGLHSAGSLQSEAMRWGFAQMM